MADFVVVPHVPETSAQPGGCFLCKCDQRQDPRTGALEPMIDTLTELVFYSSPEDLEMALQLQDSSGSSLVICRSCVLEMAVLFDCATPKQAEEWWAESNELYAKLQDAEEQLAAAQGANRLLAENFAAAFGLEPKPAEEPPPPPPPPEPVRIIPKNPRK